MEALSYVAALVIFLITLVFLLTPVSLEFDTAKKSLHVGWMGVDLRIRLDRRKPARSNFPGKKGTEEKFILQKEET